MKNLITLLNKSTNQLAKNLTKTTNHTDGENYFYYPGAGNILITAHIDTVNDASYKANAITLKDCIINKDKKPIGGDDRVGVYYGFKYHHKNKIPLLLTNYEETGGAGMHQFIEDMIYTDNNLLSDIDLIISIDRAGVGHYVTYDDQPYWLDAFMSDTGLIERQGSWSDCQLLSDAIDIPSVNVACGYHNNHTRMEYINLADLKKTAIYLDNIITLASEIPAYQAEYQGIIKQRPISTWYDHWDNRTSYKRTKTKKSKRTSNDAYLNGYNPNNFLKG